MLCAVSDPTDNRRRRPSGWHRLIGETRESLSMALDSVVSHKLRSGLTLLGIMIGVFSIIVVMTVLRVLDAYDDARDLGQTLVEGRARPANARAAPRQCRTPASSWKVKLDLKAPSSAHTVTITGTVATFRHFPVTPLCPQI